MLPKDIIEHICVYLDCYEIFNLGSTSKIMSENCDIFNPSSYMHRIASCRLKKIPIKKLIQYTNLTDLSLAFSTIDNLSMIKNLKLKRLDLTLCEVDDLSVIGSLPLETLILNYTDIYNIPNFASTVKTLEIDGTHVSDLSKVVESNIENLSVAYCKSITNLSLQGLTVTSLDISASLIDDEFYNYISLNHLKKLYITSLYEFEIHSSKLELLHLTCCDEHHIDAPNLKELKLDESVMIYDISYLDKLEILDLSYSIDINLNHLPINILSLNLSNTEHSDILDIVIFQKLKILIINKIKLKNKHVPISKLNLDKLSITGCDNLILV